MAIDKQYEADVEAILSHIGDNGGELWTTPDKRLLKGAPFSTLESVNFLLELGMEPTEPVLKASAELILSTWQDDRKSIGAIKRNGGRFAPAIPITSLILMPHH